MKRSFAILILSSLGWACSRPAYAEPPTPVDEQLVAIAIPRVIIADSGFAYAVSPVTGSAIWSAEYLTLESFKGDGKRPSGFHIDRSVPADLRANGRDYAASGFDVGHLAPDGDVGNEQDKIVRAVFTNAVPQSPGLNRGLWAQLEKQVRELVDEHHTAYVVTAPVYFVRAERIVLVGSVVKPTSLVKAVLVIEDGKPQRMLCWLAPNKNPPYSTRIDDWRVTVDEAESATQQDLFPWLPDEIEGSLEASK